MLPEIVGHQNAFGYSRGADILEHKTTRLIPHITKRPIQVVTED